MPDACQGVEVRIMNKKGDRTTLENYRPNGIIRSFHDSRRNNADKLKAGIKSQMCEQERMASKKETLRLTNNGMQQMVEFMFQTEENWDKVKAYIENILGKRRRTSEKDLI
ncbi:hypothetical protein HHI36_023422 [Cryptolaemus montrouzieri]|uniref:Uncharacterized protein n=1 Tax=Cryptolaemus montrouzieri TaxID=559131 RepID=A0ABD2PH31_9CUCU